MLSEIEQLPKKNNGVKSMKGIMMLLLNTDFVGWRTVIMGFMEIVLFITLYIFTITII